MMEYYRMLVDAWRLMKKWCVLYHGTDQEAAKMVADADFLAGRYKHHPFAEALLLAVLKELERSKDGKT